VLDEAGITQVYPIVANEDGTTRAATAAEFVEFLPLTADGSFVRNITGVTIIGQNQSAIGVIFEITSYEMALGGMYGWEQSIVNDLGALIGNGPIGSRFIDVTINNRDARIAGRGDGTELLYLIFPNTNLLLITTSRQLIEEVASRHQP